MINFIKKNNDSNYDKIINILLIFFVIIDPTNKLFHAKLLLFTLFCLVSIPKINIKYFFVPAIYFLIFGISLFIGYITHENLSITDALNVLKSYLFLVYLLFVTNDKLKTIKIAFYVCIVMSFIEIFFNIAWRISANEYRNYLYNFFYLKYDLILQGERDYYGLKILTTYYRTSSITVIPLCISLYFYFKSRVKRYLVTSIIFTLCLFCSGSRANLLSVIMVLVCMSLLYILFIKKQKILFFIFSGIICALFIVAVIFLLTRSEVSTNIKKEHILSYKSLFNENILKTIFFGYGPGRLFYTSGFDSEVAYTELSFMDLIKNHGILGTGILVSLLFIPFVNLIKNKKIDLFGKLSLSLGYASYLCIAGTNPLLVSSTGFLVVCIMFYISDKDLYFEMDESSMQR